MFADLSPHFIEAVTTSGVAAPKASVSHPRANSIVFGSDGRHGAVCGPCTAEPAPGGRAPSARAVGVKGR